MKRTQVLLLAVTGSDTFEVFNSFQFPQAEEDSRNLAILYSYHNETCKTFVTCFVTGRHKNEGEEVTDLLTNLVT